MLTVTCILTPRLTERIGARAALVLCHFTMAAGLALLLATITAQGIGWFVAATVVASFGCGISFALVADTAVSALSPDRAGSAGAIAEMSNELGNALGIALLGSVAAVVIAAVLCVVLGVVAWRVVPTGAARASTERSEERR